MGKINLLEKSVYNRIAAGEVVENPASIVKELAENSIDAGASNITVMIESGGIKSITVIDDGCGIEEEDLPLAVMPHATSKIETAEDLNSIATLGFRGEALASISSVCQVEIKSRFVDDEIAHFVIAKGDEPLQRGECSLAMGTTVSVSNLFFNTPGRYKFLKPAKTEESNVTHVVYDLMLSNPDVSIKYMIDGKLDTFTKGDGLESAICEIYGQELFDNLIPFKTSEKNYTITGFTGRPATIAIQGNKNKQIFIVNGRVFQDINLAPIIQNAYEERLMKRTFPVVILDIVMPFDEVDINVHPGKKEVRFAEKKMLNGMIYTAIKRAIEQDEFEREENLRMGMLFKDDSDANLGIVLQKVMYAIDDDSKDVIASDPSKYRVKELMNKYSLSESDLKPLGVVYKDAQANELPEDYKEFEKDLFKDGETGSEKYRMPRNVPDEVLIENVSPGYRGHFARNPYNDHFENEKKFDIAYVDENEEKQEKDTLYGDVLTQPSLSLGEDGEERRKYRIVGQIFDTYFIVESGKQLFLIDQHAAHERILYDQLMEESEKFKRVQGMLVPYRKEMSEENMEVFIDNEENLLELGFRLSFGDGALEIVAVPHMLTDINLEEFVVSVLDCKGEIKHYKDISKIKDKFATMACRSAIKGGLRLTAEEVEYVMEYFFDKGMPLQCPHGRPAVVVISKSEVEKWFKRIV